MKKIALLAMVTIALGGCVQMQPQMQSQAQPPEVSPASLAKMQRMAEERQARPEFPGEAAEHFALFRKTPNGESPGKLLFDIRKDVVAENLDRRTRSGPPPIPNLRMENFGPGNFGGRLRGILIHPGDSNLILVGSVSGGIWKTTDGGTTWAPSNDFLPTLAVGSMLLDPANPNRVWVGSGEGFFNVDSAQGTGILRSDDFGDTWTLLPATDNTNFFYVNRLGRVGANIVLAATRTGIWRSNDQGVSWTETSGVATSGRGFTDLQVDPTNTNRIFAYHYGGGDASRRMYRSFNSGTSWTALTGVQGLPTTDISRMEIGIGSDGVVYASVSNTANATRGLWRSPVGGTNFSQTASAQPFIERQGWYDLPIGVDPSDSNRVFMGAVDLFRTENAGTTITKQTFWNPGAGQVPQFVHADLHVVAFDPNDAATVFIGCDGGIFKSTDSGDTWESLDSGLNVTQYYGIATHPDGSTAIGGTQDNGSHLYFGDKTTWLQWFGGDGGYCSWDQQQTDFIYGATPFTGLFGSGDRGATSTGLTLPASPGALFITPFTIDPNDGDRMMVGTGTVLYSSNLRQLAGATFTDISGAIGGGSVSATTISPVNGADGIVGKSNGDIWMTSGLGSGGGWSKVDVAAMPATPVTWIEVDTNDGTGNTLFATFSGFAGAQVWKTTNGGASWEAIHGDLPDIPTFAIAVDPLNPERLYLGTEMGLWTTNSNDGVTVGTSFAWIQYDYGVAFSRVMQIDWVGDDVLWIGTHGRSIYRALRHPAEVAITSVTSTGCAGDADPILDNGEIADVEVTITNLGGFDMTTTTGSLSSSYPGVSVLTAAQAFGMISPGQSATATFQVEMTAGAACFDRATLPFEVTYDAGETHLIDLELQLAADEVFATGTLTEDGEDDVTLYTSEAAVDVDDWGRVTDQANTGTGSWFTSDVGNFADKSLFSPWMEVGGGTTTLTFALRYNTEGDATQRWDGAVLEGRVRGGGWVDIGQLSTVPYDGQMFTNNTIPAREAWSGLQTTWRTATVDLGTTYNGEEFQFRFRMVCDTNTGGVGFWVDDIAITNVTWLEELVCDTGCGVLFADNFESGDTSNWSVTIP